MNYLLFTRGYTIHKVPHRANEMDSNGARVLYVPGKMYAIYYCFICILQDIL